MKRILKQFIFALLISSVLAFNGLAQSGNLAYASFQGKEREKPKEREKDKEPKKEDKPKNDKPKDDKKKP